MFRRVSPPHRCAPTDPVEFTTEIWPGRGSALTVGVSRQRGNPTRMRRKDAGRGVRPRTGFTRTVHRALSRLLIDPRPGPSPQDDQGQRELRPMAKNSKPTPKLVRLRFGQPYCELCREIVRVGEQVGWWKVPGRGGRMRKTAYCATCHSANLRAGGALQ